MLLYDVVFGQQSMWATRGVDYLASPVTYCARGSSFGLVAMTWGICCGHHAGP